MTAAVETRRPSMVEVELEGIASLAPLINVALFSGSVR